MSRVRWAYGVTTVPSRRDDLLPRTLASLERAGFDDPRLFVDGCGDPDNYAPLGLRCTVRQPVVKAAGNWILGLWEMYIRDPMATYFAIFQDDVLAVKNLRSYLESCVYPEHGFWNLYNTPENEQNGGIGWYQSSQRCRGALGLVFNRDALQTLLSSKRVIEKPLVAGKKQWCNIDGMVSDTLKDAGYKEYVHKPSLLQHAGEISTVSKAVHPSSKTFPGEDFNLMEHLT